MDQLKESNNLLQYKVEVLQELIYVERCKTEEVEKKLQILKGIVIKEEETRHERMLESIKNLLAQIKNVFMKSYKEVIADLRALSGSADSATVEEFSAFWNKHFDSFSFHIAQLRFIKSDGSICLWQFLDACISNKQILQMSNSFINNLENVRIHIDSTQRLLKSKLIALWPDIKENVKESFKNVSPEDIILEAIQEVVETVIKQKVVNISALELQDLSNDVVKVCASSNSICIDIQSFITENDVKYDASSLAAVSAPPPTPQRRRSTMSAEAVVQMMTPGSSSKASATNSKHKIELALAELNARSAGESNNKNDPIDSTALMPSSSGNNNNNSAVNPPVTNSNDQSNAASANSNVAATSNSSSTTSTNSSNTPANSQAAPITQTIAPQSSPNPKNNSSGAASTSGASSASASSTTTAPPQKRGCIIS